MEGLGSDGMVLEGSVLYGATKRALRYYTQGLVKETRKTPVLVGYLSPGIVLTDLFTGDKELDARTKRIANILADRVETVTPFLVERILADKQHGTRTAWLTRAKIVRRFLTARLTRRDLFSDAP